jgi:predicted O-methyltransferase YrrM
MRGAVGGRVASFIESHRRAKVPIMPRSALDAPRHDPTPIFELFRGNYATELLTAAVRHFDIFRLLADRARTLEELRGAIGLAERPANVLMTALRAMGLLAEGGGGLLALSPLAREHLVPGGAFDVSDYVGLAADSPGVRELVERLRTNRPMGSRPDESGAAFIYREGIDSAMEAEATARQFTLSLAGRARNVAPLLAERVPMAGAKTLLDVGGGTGIYSIALLQKNPGLRAVVLDRPAVLKVAAEFAAEYGVADRLECRPGDMFAGELPRGSEAILLSNILHDWDVPECRRIVGRCAAALAPGGRLLIHDVFLNDALDGPLPVALYSAGLFSFTEGRAYSAGEYRQWLREADLAPGEIIPTLIHCGVLAGTKQA